MAHPSSAMYRMGLSQLGNRPRNTISLSRAYVSREPCKRRGGNGMVRMEGLTGRGPQSRVPLRSPDEARHLQEHIQLHADKAIAPHEICPSPGIGKSADSSSP